MAKDKFGLGRVQRGVNKALIKAISKIGVKARVHFKDNFNKEGFVDRSLERWKPRKDFKYKKRSRRKILKKSGDLKKSIRTITNRGALRAVIVSDMPYSDIHNEGGTGKSHGTSFNMPQRQFIGHSEVLDRKVEDIIEREIDSLFI